VPPSVNAFAITVAAAVITVAAWARVSVLVGRA
jgi:hypothetical protein